MQREKLQLQRQQEILKALGFYAEEIDGIWGPATIKAKQEYEKTPLFRGGIPNHGLPFSDKKPFPTGIQSALDSVTGLILLTHPALSE